MAKQFGTPGEGGNAGYSASDLEGSSHSGGGAEVGLIGLVLKTAAWTGIGALIALGYYQIAPTSTLQDNPFVGDKEYFLKAGAIIFGGASFVKNLFSLNI